jgi:hypothetical protein
MSDTPTFRRGADATAEAAAAQGGAFAKTVFFKIEDKEKAVLRFLTDAQDWIVVDQYQYVPTKPRPEGWQGNWPERMGAVSRSDPALRGMFQGDYIAEFIKKPDGKPFKASPRTWALAVRREEVIGDGSEALGGEAMRGKLLGHKDAVREETRKKEGSDETEKVLVKDIVVVNMGYKNFYSALDGFFRAYGTCVDRDYLVIRKGEGTSTDYQIAPLDPIEFTEGVRFDIRVPEVAARYGLKVVDATDDKGQPYKSIRPGEGYTGPVLEEVILSMATDDYYGRFFDPRVTTTQGSNGNGGAPAAQQAKPETDAADDRVAAMAARVKDYGGAAAPAEAAQEAAPAPAAAAASSGPRNFD